MNIQHEIKRLQIRLIELRAYSRRAELPFEEGWFRGRDDSEDSPIALSDAWPKRTLPVHMRFNYLVPRTWRDSPVWASLDVGGEGLLTFNGRLKGGIDANHQEHVLLQSARGGEQINIEIEAVPHSAFGSPVTDPKINRASLFIPEADLLELIHDLDSAMEAASVLDEDTAVPILRAVAQIIDEFDLPRSPAMLYLSRIAQTDEQNMDFLLKWEAWEFSGEALELPKETRKKIPNLRTKFKDLIAEIRSTYPPIGNLAICGHAHIDLAWLWPMAETRRKAQRTFSSVLALMDEFPDFTFTQSMAQLYTFVEQDDPRLFEQIAEHIRKERWEPIGGMWVEPDGNLISGEAWVRHLLYGQEYFQDRFGKPSNVAWLPDTFGYAGNLPQLFISANMSYFVTTKLTWNEKNTFPHHLYWWQGIDGSRILAHIFDNPGGYNSTLHAHDLLNTWRNFRGKHDHEVSLLTFGWGDGGGGPTRKMLGRYARYKEFPGLPRLSMKRVNDFFNAINVQELPVWVGEQYLELHRGTYTTQGHLKKMNRCLEHMLPQAETACMLASLTGTDYPQNSLENLWKSLLRNQFHDILPGSSVHTVNQEAESEMSSTVSEATNLRDSSLAMRSSSAQGLKDAVKRIVIWNLTLEDRQLQLSCPPPLSTDFHLRNSEGEIIPYQHIDGKVWITHTGDIPSMGYSTLSVIPGNQTYPPIVNASDHWLENDYLRVEINPDGTLESVYDKINGREALAGRGNQIWSYVDIPRNWEAWDVDERYLKEGREIITSESPRLIELGPLTAGIQIERHLPHSKIKQVYWLRGHARRLDIETWIEWQEKRTLLRALFPVNVNSPYAWFETSFGTVQRPTHRNTSWDESQFEVPAHRFIDLSEADYGVSLLNDGKYGHSVLGNVLGVSLLRGPISPDPLADLGAHHFTYSLYPHSDDWRNGTLREAHDLNAPLIAIELDTQDQGQHSTISLMSCDQPGIRLAAFKAANDGNGMIIRVYEAHGGRGRACLELSSFPIKRAWLTNILEDKETEITIDRGKLYFEFKPYQIITLYLDRK